MKNRVIKTITFLISIILFIQCAVCKPPQKEIKLLQNSQYYGNLPQSKQFIGSSVIGGLMWPVLLTLTVTAIMARVPDVLQRLLTGSGGNYRHIKYRNKRSSERDELLDETMAILKSLPMITEKSHGNAYLHRSQKLFYRSKGFKKSL